MNQNYEIIFIACDDGTFGTNCSNVCGHCNKGQACDKETGVCPNGCDSGYIGVHCKESKVSVFSILGCFVIIEM